MTLTKALLGMQPKLYFCYLNSMCWMCRLEFDILRKTNGQGAGTLGKSLSGSIIAQ
ncbi:hypothetical protein RDI58_004011 [Solanum bulbocastanum]|uniref:Uncharacterized protein n=1 Tax=Solanum bulbocastanum TaxID=147425 RepID=A0AAN8TYD0_SOLBU